MLLWHEVMKTEGASYVTKVDVNGVPEFKEKGNKWVGASEGASKKGSLGSSFSMWPKPKLEALSKVLY